MFKKIILLFLFVSLNAMAEKEDDQSYVGSEACVSCHENESAEWKGSDHERAMDHATNESVLGDFNNVEFKGKNREALFFKKENDFWVRIKEYGEKSEEYKVSYTFGYDPLQQYMVEFPDGRIQLITFTWDSRPESEGGQRWYDLYEDTTQKDEFFWKNAGQNWNFMCADCHSTDLKKNYNKEDNSYDTTWAEINVGCEACHGKGSEHVELAEKEKLVGVDHFGFDRDLSMAVKEWVFDQESHNLMPEKMTKTDQVEVCAQCHSRRLQISEESNTVESDVFDKYIVSNITAELYHSDGMIFDEDYVYGSFKQSKMSELGVTCSNCHNPHTTELKIPKEQVCLQCHMPSKYNSEKHTFHETGSAGDQCVNCHMPETVYMGVDKRADHSWHVPNPIQSAASNSPNVCTNCHENKDLKWADKQVREWFPESVRYDLDENNVAITFEKDRNGFTGIDKELSHIGQYKDTPEILRASALSRMSNHPTQNTYISLLRATTNEDSQVRYSITEGVAGMPLQQKWEILSQLIDDEVLSVRTGVASAMVIHWQELPQEIKERITPALNEHIKIQEFNADRGFGRTNLGNIYASQGKIKEAIAEYEGAILIEPYYEFSYINLSQLYSQQNEKEKSLTTLARGVENNPEAPNLHYSYSLAQLRNGMKKEAIETMKRAIQVAPQEANYLYTFGLMVEKDSPSKAAISLYKAFLINSNPQYLYASCEVQLRNNLENAMSCLEKLKLVAPKEAVDKLRSSYN